MKKQGEKEYLEEHSKEKIKFFKKYLDDYLAILLNSSYTKGINIYDIFCGVGLYSDDKSKGSPVVAMESIKKFKSSKKIRLLINDGDERRLKIAKYHIENNYNNSFEFEYHNLLAEDIFKLTIDKIKLRQNENHFIFIDPHGYKDINKNDIVDIMEAGKSEILIFLPIHMMYRFLKPSQKDQKNSSYKPLIEFMDTFELNYKVSNPKEYIEHIKHAFSFQDKYLTTSYILQSDTKNDYAIFFITKSFRGLEKAVETKWKLDELCGKGFVQKEAPNLFYNINQEEKKEDCLNNLKQKLNEYLQKPKTNNDLYKFTLKNGFLLKDTRALMKRLQKDNKLFFDRAIRKNSFYINYKNNKNNNIKYKVQINE